MLEGFKAVAMRHNEIPDKLRPRTVDKLANKLSTGSLKGERTLSGISTDLTRF